MFGHRQNIDDAPGNLCQPRSIRESAVLRLESIHRHELLSESSPTAAAIQCP